jgi:hypothetical protein
MGRSPVTTQPIEVEIRVKSDGTILPIRVMWNGRWVSINQISRQWSDDSGDHFLVMIFPPEKVLDLIHTPEGTWQAIDHGGGRMMA